MKRRSAAMLLSKATADSGACERKACIAARDWMAWSASFKSVAPFTLFGLDTTVYPAVVALIVNLLVAVVATPLLAAAGVDRGTDETAKPDYEAQVGEPIGALAEGPGKR